MLGVPLGEIALLILAVVVAGVATGILAGLFGIGGGAITEMSAFSEVFRILGVPEEVRMQLCVGTSNGDHRSRPPSGPIGHTAHRLLC